MRFSLCLSIVVAAVLPGVALAQDATIVSRDVPLLGARSLAAATPPVRFNLVGVHWRGPGAVSFRTHSVAGRWSGWVQAAPEAEDRPDVGTGERARRATWRVGNPWWVGLSNRIEYRLRGRVRRLRAFYVWSPAAAIPLRGLQKAGSPAIVPRAGWGADESIKRAAPSFAPEIRTALVHHTAGSNGYSAAESAAIVRGIQIYHVKGNGWNDIGYNFLVDRFGKVFEGRYGGIDRNVVGAHAEGFNTGTVGAAVLGEYGSLKVTPQARESLARLLAWRLDLAHVEPVSTVSYISGGNARFPAGVPVFLRAVSGHRDTGFTDCPGSALYTLLGSIAGEVSGIGLPKIYAPAVTGAVPGRVRFRARLSSPLDWLVDVTDARGTSVAATGGYGQTVDWTWNGSGLQPGSYAYTIRAQDATPALGRIGGVASAPTSTLAVTGVAADPETITPNDDGAADAATVTYTLSAPATVTISIRDEFGGEVAQVSRVWRRAAEHTVSFDGLDLPDGIYHVQIDAQATGGRMASGSVQVAVTRTLGSLVAAPPEFSPNRDGRADRVVFSFALAAPAEVRLRILRDGKWVSTLLAGAFQPGRRRIEWDGARRLGRVRDGSYEAVVEATDAVATAASAVPFAADTVAPGIRIVRRAPLSVWLSEPARLTLRSGNRSFRRDVVRAGVSRVAAPRAGLIRIVAWDGAGNVSRPVSRR